MNPPHKSLKIKTRKINNQSAVVGVYRHLYFTQTGLGVPLLVPFKPALRSVLNEYAASIHRYGCDMPTTQNSRPFVEYCRALIRRIFVPIREVPTWEEYLACTSYNEKRKNYFTELRERTHEISKKTRRVQAFIKDEGYLEPKNARAILSPSDESKVMLGPLVHAMDKATFASVPNFVKGTDPATWPQMLRDRFGTRPVQCTDFSSFEAHHRNLMCDVVWAWMDHMTSMVEGVKPLRTLMRHMVYSRNVITFPCTTAEIDQRLMSGAMWTSSANGVLNLMIMSYLSLRTIHDCDGAPLAEKWSDFVGYVEGDDGVFATNGPIKEEDIKRLGCKLKIRSCSDIATAGFCSNYFDMTNLSTVRDPVKVLTTFPVLPKDCVKAKRSTVLGMLRAKAMSLKYQCPNAPIAGPLADAVLRITRGHDTRAARNKMDAHAREIFDQARKKKLWLNPAQVQPESRELVERMFGVAAADQMNIEKKFDAWESGALELDLLNHVTPEMLDHALEFVTIEGTGLYVREPNLNLVPLITAGVNGRTTLSMPHPEGGRTVQFHH